MNVEEIQQWLDAEIAQLISNIQRHRGVGVYLSHCEIWALRLDICTQLRGMIIAPELAIVAAELTNCPNLVCPTCGNMSA